MPLTTDLSLVTLSKDEFLKLIKDFNGLEPDSLDSVYYTADYLNYADKSQKRTCLHYIASMHATLVAKKDESDESVRKRKKLQARFEKFLKEGADIMAKDVMGLNALHIAAKENDFSMVGVIMETVLDLLKKEKFKELMRTTDNVGSPIMHIATKNGAAETAAFIYEILTHDFNMKDLTDLKDKQGRDYFKVALDRQCLKELMDESENYRLRAATKVSSEQRVGTQKTSSQDATPTTEVLAPDPAAAQAPPPPPAPPLLKPEIKKPVADPNNITKGVKSGTSSTQSLVISQIGLNEAMKKLKPVIKEQTKKNEEETKGEAAGKNDQILDPKQRLFFKSITPDVIANLQSKLKAPDTRERPKVQPKSDPINDAEHNKARNILSDITLLGQNGLRRVPEEQKRHRTGLEGINNTASETDSASKDVEGNQNTKSI